MAEPDREAVVSRLSSDSSFLQRVRAALPHLHPAERRLGEFLFRFPGEIASYDAQELARLAGVSKATVSRFVRRIGFASYEEARRQARAEGASGSRLFQGHAEHEAGARALDLDMAESKENLDWTFRRIGADELDAVAQAILGARRVWLIGYRISQSFATYLQWQLLKVAPDVQVIPKGGETLGEHLAAMTQDDCAIFFALRRRVAGTDMIIDEILRRGPKLALVTDEGMAPRDGIAWHFLCQTRTAGPQFNHAAVFAVCHQIMQRATLAAGVAARERLRDIEETNERIGFL